MFHGNDVMNLKSDPAPAAFMVAVAARLAGVAVSPQNLQSDPLPFRRVPEATMATFPVAMILTAGDAVRVPVLGQTFVPSDPAFLGIKPSGAEFRIVADSFVDMRPVVIGFVAGLKSHLFDGWMIALLHALVPSRDTLGFPAVGMVSSDVLGGSQAATFGSATVDGKSRELGSAPAFADDVDSLTLCFGYAHFSFSIECAVHYTGKIESVENRVNCWDTLKPLHHNVAGNGERDGLKSKRMEQWAISSQSAGKPVAGSTTRSRRLNPEQGMAVKAHECATAIG